MKALELGALLSACVAVLHVAILVGGAPAFRYFGAGERMARMSERGLAMPAVITVALVIMFAVWAAYALSGAGRLARLPLLRTVLTTIGVTYTLRGLVLVPQAVLFLRGQHYAVPPRHLVFSAASLIAGLAYLVGVRPLWRFQRPARDLK